MLRFMIRFIVVVLNLLSSSAPVIAHEANPVEMNRLTLQAIDSICGDTWCEGDYQYRFDSLRCRFQDGICVLNVRYGEWPAEGQSVRYTHKIRCTLTRVNSYADLIEISPLLRLKDDPYEQITACLP